MEYPIEPFVISGEGVLTPPDRDRWVTEDMFIEAGRQPTFTAQEVGEVFFGNSTVWLRKRLWERAGIFEPGRTSTGHRRFGLHQIEDFAHLLLEDEMISPLHFAMTIRIIKSLAILKRYEIGDTGFLLGHWNGTIMTRRQVVTRVMERLEEFDAGRMRPLDDPPSERAISEAAAAIRHAEKLAQEAP